jgi:hypothetical protein
LGAGSHRTVFKIQHRNTLFLRETGTGNQKKNQGKPQGSGHGPTLLLRIRVWH